MERFFGEAGLSADLGDGGRQLGMPQDELERLTHAADVCSDRFHRGGERLVVRDVERELGAEGLHRLQPDRIPQVRRRRGRVQVDQGETWEILDHLALLEPAPVLVLAPQHRLETGRPQPSPAVQDRHHGTDGEVPVADDGVDAAVERVELLLGLGEEVVQRDLLSVLQFLHAQQGMESVSAGIGQLSEYLMVQLVQPEHEDVRSRHPRAIPWVPSATHWRQRDPPR